MNLTLSLDINGGTAKKRKVRDGVADDVGGDGGDRGRAMRLLEARGRMMARLELFDPRVVPDDDGAGSGLRLMHLFVSSVAAGEAGDAHAAAAALQEVSYRRASFRAGDPAQRVAAYFADALASRLLQSPVAASPPTRAEQFLAYTMFYQASPFYQFAHFTANQAIVEAFQDCGRRRLHIVDFDVSYGFQWPSLIQSLSDAAATSTSSSNDGDCEEPVSLRITGFGTTADELRQTEARLARFASGCPNLRFEFEGVVNGPNNGRHDRIKTDDAATVVVNLVLTAAQNSRTCSREACSAVARIRSLNPSLVFLVEKDEGGGTGSSLTGGNATSRQRSSLLPRFTASLRYFAAVFDSLHECLPADSTERLAIERNHLGKEISNAVFSLDHHHGDDHMAADESSSSASWKEMMEAVGFEGVKLSSRTVSQAKLLLKMKSGCGGAGGGFQVIEGDGGRAMSLGWRDNALITATAWRRRQCEPVIDQQDIPLGSMEPVQEWTRNACHIPALLSPESTPSERFHFGRWNGTDQPAN
ncbi:scarecrow-like protein 23 [Phragmites australis]|uniref:scarecrow-like protein 23 n=1 Tax=Phragmites australis TaxID=29695 RepID=UPI002D792DD6|nr:scarecrow-like protein 23 [Phragmites australis]